MSKKKALEGTFEYGEYKDQLNEEELAYVRQFYNEYYANGTYNQETPLLTADEHLKDARRRFNALYRDAYNVSRNIGKLEYTADEKAILELASDETDYETAYSQGGMELAIQVVMDQSVRDIEAGQNKRVCLSRFYVKMERLRKNKQKEERKEKKRATNTKEQ